jgi:hypothetical protein
MVRTVLHRSNAIRISCVSQFGTAQLYALSPHPHTAHLPQDLAGVAGTTDESTTVAAGRQPQQRHFRRDWVSCLPSTRHYLDWQRHNYGVVEEQPA